MLDPEMIELSRWQFAITALFHFLFVPLTLGLSWILVIMESVYVMTGKAIYRDMTMFWGKLFGINFALGIATGLTMEFQFGTNWAYFSHYVGDVFGVPLAIEGLVAFFLESTFVGMFFLGWERLSKKQHLVVTFLTALGTSFSALWILIANAWMQNPVGAEFNYQTMRMEMTSFSQIIFNPVAQVKFIHTVAAGYVAGSIFVLGISSYYLLKGRDLAFASRSFAIAAGFGLASVLSVIVLGDESGYKLGDVQKTKLAAIEAEWETHPAPAGFMLFGIPDQQAQHTHAAIKIPWLMGIIATRSIDTEVTGLKDIMQHNEKRIRNGMTAYALLEKLRHHKDMTKEQYSETVTAFEAIKYDLGYGLLLKAYTPTVVDATEAQIKQAVKDTIPPVTLLFWAFRIMVAAGFALFILFFLSFYYCAKRTIMQKKWLLKMLLYSIPLPWIAIESGWIVAEVGRQPWAVGEVLPTFLATSSLTANDIWISLIGFILVYTFLFIVEIWLMFHFARKGPSSLGTGKYYFEKQTST
jgi:cytochrome d ubiquinol oxidase subunit I